MLANLPLPLKLRQFDSGVLVLQSNLHDDDVVITQTSQLVSLLKQKFLFYDFLKYFLQFDEHLIYR